MLIRIQFIAELPTWTEALRVDCPMHTKRQNSVGMISPLVLCYECYKFNGLSFSDVDCGWKPIEKSKYVEPEKSPAIERSILS